MQNIQQLISNLQTDLQINNIDESIALEEIKIQLAQGNIKSDELLEYLQTLKKNQFIPDSLLQKLFGILGDSNAETVVVSDRTVVKTSNNIPADDSATQIATKVATRISTKNNAQVDTPTENNETQLANTQINADDRYSDKTRIAGSNSDSETVVQSTNDVTSIATPANKTPIKLRSGSILKERFILKDVIGSGGMSIVFRALDLRKQEAKNQNPYVAIKVLGDSFKHHPLSLLALERETQKIQSLAHPNIITVYDFDRDGEHIYMTMECLNGQSLDGVIRDNKSGMSFEKARPMIEDMCQALIYAHSKDIIHSDFKPENVFHLENNVTKVLDFGIARAKKLPGRKQADTVFDAGSLSALTPPYASLEMLLDLDPDPRDDIYALGCVIYKLLTGKHPYKNLQADLALKAELAPDKIDSLNRKQWQTLLSSLAFKREDRIETVEAFLEGIIPKKRPTWIYGLAAGVVIAIGLSGYLGTSITEKNALPKIELTVEQENKIKNYLEIAELYYSLGYLATPPGDSALDQYEKVLAINPANQVAIAGKKKLVEQYNKLAMMKFELNELEDALLLVETGLSIDSDNEELLESQVKITERQSQLK